MKHPFLAFFTLFVLATSAQNDQLDLLVEQWHDAAEHADSAKYFGAFASDESIFQGTDATEYWTVEEFKTWAAPFFRRESAWTFHPMERTWHQHGDVFWFSERLSSTHMGLCRGTGIVVNTEDGWKIDYYSLSFEVPNEVVSTVVPLLDSNHVEVLKFRKELNDHYLDPEHSPLTDEERAHFQGHEFFEYDPKYVVEAELELTPKMEPFEMATSSGKTQSYRVYGILTFTLDGQKHTLEVYESLRLKNIPEYANHLFLPFKDQSTGVMTYGTGRFMDLEKPTGSTLTLNFNLCYNPYCAYTDGYSCPITPETNTLNTIILAGIRGPKKTH